MTAEFVSAIQMEDGTCQFAVSFDGADPEVFTYGPPTLEEGEEFDREAYAATCAAETRGLVQLRVDQAKEADALDPMVEDVPPPAGTVTLEIVGEVIE